MELSERKVTLDAGGEMDAYLVVPSGNGSPRRGLVVIMEAFGVNSHIQDLTRRFAREGFVAIAPELFHRTGRNVISDDYTQFGSIAPHFQALTNEGIETDVRASLEHLRSRPDVDAAQVAIVGYCVGGFGAFLAACRCDVSRSVVYYGGGIVRERPQMKLQLKPLLHEVGGIRAPMQLHFGDQDQGIPLADVEAIRAKLDEAGVQHELHVYPGAGHGFFCDQRASYHPGSAATAWERTVRFLGA